MVPRSVCVRPARVRDSRSRRVSHRLHRTDGRSADDCGARMKKASLRLRAGLAFFGTPSEFRAWFEQHHDTHDELLVGFHKKGTGTPSITWPESVDQALCFGWIDGVRRRIDEERYSIRFTPRRPRSIWRS